MPKCKYKVGDRVRILPLEQLETCEDYVPEMKSCAGIITTIEYTTEELSVFGPSYHIAADNNVYWWHEPMMNYVENYKIDLDEILKFLDE